MPAFAFPIMAAAHRHVDCGQSTEQCRHLIDWLDETIAPTILSALELSGQIVVRKLQRA